MQVGGGARRGRPQDGAALVELAIVVPILFAILLGVVTYGTAYNTKITLSNAAREASRYGATLPVGNFVPGTTPGCAAGAAPLACWLASVATTAGLNAEGELGSSVSSRYVCVAYVYPGGSASSTSDRTYMLERTAAGDTVTNPAASSTAPACFVDGRADTERRVQVRVSRQRSLQAVIYSTTLTLSSDSVTHFEAT